MIIFNNKRLFKSCLLQVNKGVINGDKERC